LDNNYRYVYDKMDSRTLWILGSVFFVIVCCLFFVSPAFGAVSGIITLVYLIPSENGIEIDIVNKKYRLFDSKGPLSFGEWHNFSDAHYISVFKAVLVSNPFTIPADYENRTNVTQVNLITGDNKRLKFLETMDNDEAWQFAKEIAPKLNLRIWDATGPRGKWFESDVSEK